jgi:hypothetical protein
MQHQRTTSCIRNQPWQSERWHRITMAVTCEPVGKKGQFKTWVEDAAMASLQARR